MSDRMPAELWVGGKLLRSLLDEFPISDLRLDWDEHPIDATSEEGILSARDESGLLHFADTEAAYGEFAELEDWLREHNIPFQRQASGKYEYDPCWIEFRPDLPASLPSGIRAMTASDARTSTSSPSGLRSRDRGEMVTLEPAAWAIPLGRYPRSGSGGVPTIGIRSRPYSTATARRPTK